MPPDEPLRFTGRLRYEDLLDLHRLRWRLLRRKRKGLFGSLLLACSVAVVLHVHNDGDSNVLLIAAVLALGALPWLRDGYRQLAERRQLRAQADVTVEATATISADFLTLSEDGMEVRLAWRRLAAVFATERGVTFMTPPQSVWFHLPRRVFADEAQSGMILAFAEANGVRVLRW